VKDRASIAARVVMAIIRSRVGAVFKGQPVSLAQGEIEVFLRSEFADAEQEAVDNFRKNRPAA
jgi:hypothetical protein